MNAPGSIISIPQGPIEALQGNISIPTLNSFQFHKVRLKQQAVADQWLRFTLFQFHKVRLKPEFGRVKGQHQANFNSTRSD